MTVGFTGSQVEYISVPASSGYVEVGGERLPIRLHDWVGRFGKPTFAGDDGAGYVDANGIAAKLFLDSRTGEAESVDFFSGRSRSNRGLSIEWIDSRIDRIERVEE